MSQSDPANFVLIDGVLSPQTMADLYRENEPVDLSPLYTGTRWGCLKDLGPTLLKSNDRSSLTKDWFNNPAAQTYTTLMSSAQSLNAVAGHLRRFICPPDGLGGNGVLRFSDPLVAHYWLSSLSEEQRNELFGPIEHWWVHRPVHRWQSAKETPWQVFSRTRPVPAGDIEHIELGHSQLAALDEARRWKFEEDAHEWLVERDELAFADMNSQQISSWLKATIDLGLEWGLVGERALIIWAETTMDLGDEFATRVGSPYLDWLLINPEHPRLAPDLRIKAFDQHRYSQKDFSHAR